MPAQRQPPRRSNDPDATDTAPHAPGPSRGDETTHHPAGSWPSQDATSDTRAVRAEALAEERGRRLLDLDQQIDRRLQQVLGELAAVRAELATLSAHVRPTRDHRAP